MDIKIENWKNKLLDLGKRNKLINYKETKRSTLKIVKPSIEELWVKIVEEEKEITFPYYDDSENNQEDESIKNPSNLVLDKNFVDLQATLRNLKSKSKIIFEEQGINALYLSFGFIKWNESNFSLLSPLLLVPVTLINDSLISPYKLSWQGDEIVVNPTLKYKFFNDFGIELPNFDENDSLNDYFEKVEKIIARTKWEVKKEVSLSLLSFLKINMYSDLENHKEEISTNPIINAIAGISSLENSDFELVNNYDFDEKDRPIDTFQIVDADSSQQEALLLAKLGESFVLQGPPGTGKSQTITNIISEALAYGKKVLFVSEKKAALDVVYHRLSQAKLSDFCLILHSHKTNKRFVLDQLAETLSLADSKTSITDDAFRKLDYLQNDIKHLNDYSNQLFEIVYPLGKNIYEANGIIAKLINYEDIIFDIKDVRNTSKEQYNEYLYLVKQLANSIGKMTTDILNNPWKDTNLSIVTNEFRHDLSYKTNEINEKFPKIYREIKSLFEQLSLDNDITIEEINNIIDVLDVAKYGKRIPSSWILTDELEFFEEQINEQKIIQQDFNLYKRNILEQYKTLNSFNNYKYDYSLSRIESHNDIFKDRDKVNNILNEKPFLNLENDNLLEAKELFKKICSEIDVINNTKNSIANLYEDTVYELDYREILDRFKTEYTSIFKFFNKQYKEDKNLIRKHRIEIVKKVTDEEILLLLSQLKTLNKKREWLISIKDQAYALFDIDEIDENYPLIQIEELMKSYEALKKINILLKKSSILANNINESEEILKNRYSFLYNGINTDWEFIKKLLSWAMKFKETVRNKNISRSFIENICENENYNLILDEKKQKTEKYLREIEDSFGWFRDLFYENNNFNQMNLLELKDFVNQCNSNLMLLEEWIDYDNNKRKCNEFGLNDFIEKIESQNLESEKLLGIFNKRFFRLWLDAVMPEYPAVLQFRRKNQDKIIKEFSELDKYQFEIAKARIRSSLINSLPNTNCFTTGNDELGILKRELNKQKRIKPMRKLFKEIPNLLMNLKPCLMMSPLSVSLFLEADSYKFDLVIFDEASQVCTENAIGAIFRGKQVIIAGDSKQLPPTSFFQNAFSDADYNEDDELDDLNAYESILDEANLLPEKTLKWHYRSRHESLISFSNNKIYRNNLITFPSNIDNVPDNGVEYIYVKDGFYDRGGRKGNIAEAKKVAELVFEHFQKNPNRSLGVISFGENQQVAIETILREMRIKDKRFEAFFSEEKDEPFFIKNLENVQGDERDTIIFSIGYAKDSNGVMKLNFGPLSRTGGERRLNVAITRAKYNIKLVGSLLPTDIDPDRITTEGPKLLRTYIDFAMRGQKALDSEITESDDMIFDSPFELSVYNLLVKKGYKVNMQVGCSGYRIDMGVKHPTIPGVYVLGIECDGATYHSARTARERDRLRQDVLENMGWNIYRIWSTDWIKDPTYEIERLLTAVNDAITKYDIKKMDEEVNALENVPVCEEFISIEKKEDFYEFEEYKPTSFDHLKRDEYGYLQIEDCILEMLNNEYPIHFELLCQQLAYLFGNSRNSSRIRENVNYGLKKLKGKIKIKDDFIFPKEYEYIPIRMPNTRKIDYISIDEIKEALLIVIAKNVGLTKDSVIRETERIYGFNRSGPKITESFNKAFNGLIRQNKIQVIDDKVSLK